MQRAFEVVLGYQLFRLVIGEQASKIARCVGARIEILGQRKQLRGRPSVGSVLDRSGTGGESDQVLRQELLAIVVEGERVAAKEKHVPSWWHELGTKQVGASQSCQKKEKLSHRKAFYQRGSRAAIEDVGSCLLSVQWSDIF